MYWPLLLVLWATVSSAQDQPQQVDRVVVVVDNVILTASQVALNDDLVERDPSSVPAIGDGTLDSLSAAIDSIIIRNVAGLVPVYQPSPADVRARISRFRDGWASPREFRRFLRVHGLNDDRLAGALQHRMIVERVVRRNVPPRSGETNEAYRDRYDEWLGEQRAMVRVRHVQEQVSP